MGRRVVIGLAAAILLLIALPVAEAQAPRPVRFTLGKFTFTAPPNVASRIRAALNRQRAASATQASVPSGHRPPANAVFSQARGLGARTAVLAPSLHPTFLVPPCLAYYQRYLTTSARLRFADTGACNLGYPSGGGTQSHYESAPGSGSFCDGYPGRSVDTSPEEVATFKDGEAALLCSTPDDNGVGGSRANRVPFTFAGQAFGCEATVGVGRFGHKALNVFNRDSIELYQSYTDRDGNSVSSVTTVCVGALPAGVKAPRHSVVHKVACSELNPLGAGSLHGYGLSATLVGLTPRPQYLETCNVPNYAL